MISIELFVLHPLNSKKNIIIFKKTLFTLKKHYSIIKKLFTKKTLLYSQRILFLFLFLFLNKHVPNLSLLLKYGPSSTPQS
jgi:hypothetical protein